MTLTIYLSIVATLGVLSLFLMMRKLRAEEHSRIRRLKKKRRINLGAPHSDDSNHELQEIRIQGVETRFNLFRKIAIPGILLGVVLLLAFPFLGELPRTFISLALTGAGVTLGIACKTPIENLAAGIILSFTQPIRIGDTVLLDGEYGVIEDIGIIHTTVQLWDYRRLVINNSVLLNKQLINYSLNDKYQWAYVEFWISYETDIELVEQLAKRVASESQHFADYDDPAFWIMDFDKQGIKCWVAAWAENPREAWNLKCDIRTRLTRVLQQNNITMHSYRIDINL
jgi:small-conductance mechanosensitive channel